MSIAKIVAELVERGEETLANDLLSIAQGPRRDGSGPNPDCPLKGKDHEEHEEHEDDEDDEIDAELEEAVASEEVTAAEELPLEQAPPDALKALKSAALEPEQYFEGIHGKILRSKQRGVSGIPVRLTAKRLTKLTKIKGFRWLEGYIGGISVGF